MFSSCKFNAGQRVPGTTSAKVDSVSYALGAYFGGMIKSSDFGELNKCEMKKGLNDVMNGGELKIAAVKAPGFGDRRKAMLQDIAVLTGGEVITSDLGLELKDTAIEQLGRAKQVKIQKENTIIVDGNGNKEEIAARVKQIRIALEETKSEYEKENLALNERLAKLQAKELKLEAEYASFINKAKKEANEIIVKAQEDALALISEIEKKHENFKEHELAELKHQARQLEVIDVDTPTITDFKVGDEVFVKGWQRNGKITKINKDKYEVLVGNFTVTFTKNELSVAKTVTKPVTKPKKYNSPGPVKKEAKLESSLTNNVSELKNWSRAQAIKTIYEDKLPMSLGEVVLYWNTSVKFNDYLVNDEKNVKEDIFYFDYIDCPNCASKVEIALNKSKLIKLLYFYH